MYFFSFFSEKEVDFPFLGTNSPSTQLYSSISSLLVSSHSLSSQRYKSTLGILEVQISWPPLQTFLSLLSHSRFPILLPLFLLSSFFPVFVFSLLSSTFSLLIFFLFLFLFVIIAFFVSIWTSCHLYFSCSPVDLHSLSIPSIIVATTS